MQQEETKNLIEATLPYFVEAEATEETIYNQLTSTGVDAHLANQIISFVPLAFGRVLMQNLLVGFSKHYTLHTNNKRPHDYLLSEEPVYQAALLCAEQAVTNQTWTEHLHVAIALWSAETQAVNSALISGSQPEDLEISNPQILADIGPKQAKVNARPWWKIW
ncbi:hypothetical protein [Hymenobacter volaticus]|uniref:DUF1320 domain-containing protein n=1 Tax=Hymenobacter volaticus TaxID=2932254 RepID=A0ABY4G0Z7_9BACT|nr:hypothetical protein [Hymenobacter volaticus]UOQ64513.1 hypothetical protein MUN86_13050 [Hymenobacter volaticus]